MSGKKEVGWDLKSLGELAEIKGGKRVPKGYRLETELTNHPYIRVTDFNENGSVDLDDIHYINEEVFNQIKNYTISTKDLYISIAGTIGKTGIIPEELDGANLTENACKLVFKVNVNPKFVYYFTKTDNFLRQAGLNTRVAAMPKLALTRLSTINLYFPSSLNEQQRIVAILDEAFAAIAKAKANAEQNLKNAKELFESYLQSVFENKGENWEEKTLEQVSKIFGRGKSRHRPRNYEKLYGGDYPFIQTGDIRNCNHYVTEYTQTYSELGLAQSKLWPAGTICITIAANIAETGVLTFEACFPDSVIGLVVNDKLADRNFVEYLLQSFKARIQALGKGSAQANINMGTFENELFPFPSVKDQQIIIQKLDALSAETKQLEAIYQQKINDLDELKKSILQKAFAGELC